MFPISPSLLSRYVPYQELRDGATAPQTKNSMPCRPPIWVFPKIMVSPNHPFVHRVFHYKPSILGPLFLEMLGVRRSNPIRLSVGFVVKIYVNPLCKSNDDHPQKWYGWCDGCTVCTGHNSGRVRKPAFSENIFMELISLKCTMAMDMSVQGLKTP